MGKQDLAIIRARSPYPVVSAMRHDPGGHPEDYVNYEQLFAAEMIYRRSPKNILDVGSNRHFLLGLMSAYDLTTVDIRQRRASPSNETCLVCDAKKLDLEDGSFDLVLSLNSIEHFGLGRYGDEIDLEGDSKALWEMLRVLRPGGWLVFSTTIHRAETVIMFNAHRIYGLSQLSSWFTEPGSMISGRFFSRRLGAFVPYEQVTAGPQKWDVYCGCWEKR